MSGDIEAYEEAVAIDDINATDNFGRPAIFYAVSNNRVKLTLDLLARGAVVSIRSPGGYNVFSRVSSRTDPHIVRALLDSGADPSDVDGKGTTLLSMLRPGNHYEEVRRLLTEHAP